MVTWMQHPKHGKHPATGAEIENLKANGWTACLSKAKAQEMEPIVTDVGDTSTKPQASKPSGKRQAK